jgi:dimethylhistidine N-methyltransferase
MTLLERNEVELIDCSPSTGDFVSEVLNGLKKKHKKLSPKLFYDKSGSYLFEQITNLPEYYITLTELSILQENASEIASMIGNEAALLEFGSGSSKKIKILLDQLSDLTYYIPIDISKKMLIDSAECIADEYGKVKVMAICADFTEAMTIPPLNHKGKKAIFYPGSTIGNFDPEDAKLFLKRSSAMLDKGDGLLIGVDLKKDPNILNQAYNDKDGVTAEFNLNVLRRINQELNANFNLDLFSHLAFYNRDRGRIEMHIQSLADQTVSVKDETFTFSKDETIHTENSYKYTMDQFQSMADESGFTPAQVWTDPNEWFSVHYLQVD